MKISTKSRYGLQAMIYLAKRHGKICSLKEIAQNEAIPLAYLEKILSRLEKGNLVESRKGVKGGYCVSRDLKKINVAQIMETLEGPVALVFCISQNQAKTCPKQMGCLTRGVWMRLQKAIEDSMRKISLYQLIK